MAPNGVQAKGGMSLGMESENFGYSRVRLRRVKKLQFGAINPDELVRDLQKRESEICERHLLGCALRG